MQARHWRGVAAFAAVTTLLAAFAGGAQARTDGGSGATAAASYKVGIVYSRTGLLAAYGAEYIQGLRYGLAYATKGTMKVNGRPIRVIDVSPGMVRTDEFALTRFGGDADKAAAVYEGVAEPLVADDIADIVTFAVTRPHHVNIDRLVIRPLAQAAQHKVHRVT